MSAFTEEQRRYILEEYESGTKIKAIADHLGKRYQTIRSAIHSKWYADMKADVDQFEEEVEAQKTPEEPVTNESDNAVSEEQTVDNEPDTDQDEEDDEEEQEETLDRFLEEQLDIYPELMDHDALDEAFDGESVIPF